MPWIKQGLIFHLNPAACRSEHTQVPTPLVMEDRIRIYYACRNKGQSFIAFVDVDRDDPKKVIRIHEAPVMPLGEPGMFDSDGTMPSCVVRKGDEIWLFYIGWNARESGARYQNEIGIAVSADGGESFTRMFKGPIMGRTPTEPGLAVMPFIVYNNWLRMWYQSGTSWEYVNGKYEPVYVIKYAESLDGVFWNRKEETCIRQSYKYEAFSRPTVIVQGKTYHQWYCYRDSKDYRGGKGSYRIGYAQSKDGINFKRMDESAGISMGGEDEFDSQMICYPYVFENNEKLMMLYNGNDFGQTGIGYAHWEGPLP